MAQEVFLGHLFSFPFQSPVPQRHGRGSDSQKGRFSPQNTQSQTHPTTSSHHTISTAIRLERVLNIEEVLEQMPLIIKKRTDGYSKYDFMTVTNTKRSRIKQKLHLISNKESIVMRIARIETQNDVRRHICHFVTTEDIPVHDQQNIEVLTSSQFTQAC
jgi:hypothetical protein